MDLGVVVLKLSDFPKFCIRSERERSGVGKAVESVGRTNNLRQVNVDNLKINFRIIMR